jgi:hypothetical protein
MSNHSATTVSNPSAVNTQAKDMLARILAGENLIVEHNPKAHTAMFDTKTRILTLPMWENMSESMYDMLIGHEVGHALYTPWTERDEAANGIAAAFDIGGEGNAMVAMDYLNVVEDARIERMVQDKFPGIRRDFFNAYGEMVKSDFFGLNGTNINDLPLLDRINIHFKLGTQAPQQLIFTPDEQKFIDRITGIQSFDDTVAVATDLFAFCGNKRNDEKRKQFLDGNAVPVPSNYGDADGDGTVTANGDDDANDGNSKSNGKSNDDSNDDSNDGDSAGGYETSDKMTQTPARSKTQKAIDAKLKQHRSNCTGINYGVLDTPNLDNIVWDYKSVAADLADFSAKHSSQNGANNPYGYKSHMTAMTECYNQFLIESAPLVNNMVKQFEMRKAADKAKRTATARSGVLDTVRMMNYRLTDDIFRRNAIVTDGKNHGLVMYIDWSSSMTNVLLNTVKQMLILTQFCKKVNIPFEVYAFSSVPMNPDLIKTGDYGAQVSEASNYWKPVTIGHAKSAYFQTFSLINLMSSRMKGNEYKTGLLNAFRIGFAASNYSPIIDTKYMLGSTPLDECIVAAMDMVPKFRDANKLQIVNTVFLTDGESSGNRLPTGGYYNQKGFVIDPVTRKTYDNNSVDGSPYGGSTTTATLLRIFRDRTKTNAIGFFLTGAKTLNNSSPWYVGKVRDENAYTKAAASYTDNGFAESLPEHNGYTVQYIIRSVDMDVSNENAALAKIGNGATVAQVTRALAKDAATKNKSKLMLNRFIDLIAKA